MPQTETVFLDQDQMLVTQNRIVVDGVSRLVPEVRDVRIESSSAYRGKSLPFVIGLGFVLWALTELLNGPPAYGWAAVAGFLALLSFFVVRLVGDFQVHTVYLQAIGGDVAVLQSRDGKSVSALVAAVRKALAQRGAYASNAWAPESAARG